MTEIQSINSKKSTKDLDSASAELPVGMSTLDKLSYLLIPEIVRGDDVGTLEATASALYREGARGPAMRRLLCRSIATTNAEKKYREAVLAVEFERVARGESNLKRLQALDDMVSRSAARLHEDIDSLARLTSANVPNVKIHVYQAAINAGGSANVE